MHIQNIANTKLSYNMHIQNIANTNVQRRMTVDISRVNIKNVITSYFIYCYYFSFAFLTPIDKVLQFTYIDLQYTESERNY